MTDPEADAPPSLMPFLALHQKVREKMNDYNEKCQVHFDWLDSMVEEAEAIVVASKTCPQSPQLMTPSNKRAKRKRTRQPEETEPRATSRSTRNTSRVEEETVSDDTKSKGKKNKEKFNKSVEKEKETSSETAEEMSTDGTASSAGEKSPPPGRAGKTRRTRSVAATERMNTSTEVALPANATFEVEVDKTSAETTTESGSADLYTTAMSDKEAAAATAAADGTFVVDQSASEVAEPAPEAAAESVVAVSEVDNDDDDLADREDEGEEEEEAEQEDKRPVRKTRSIRGSKRMLEKKGPAGSDTEDEAPSSKSRKTSARQSRADGKRAAAEPAVESPVPKPRSTRTRQKLNASMASSEAGEQGSASEGQSGKAARSTRTRQKNPPQAADEPVVQVQQAAKKSPEKPVRSTRTRQKMLMSSEASESEKEAAGAAPNSVPSDVANSASENELPKRSTRTRQRQTEAAEGGGEVAGLTRSVASPRVKELAARALSPATRVVSPRRVPGYTGSAVSERVQVFEKAMKASAGLSSDESSQAVVVKSTRQVMDMLNEQPGAASRPRAKTPEVRKGAVIRSGGSSHRRDGRAPPGKVVRPMGAGKVFASGGSSRGVSPAVGASGGRTGSSSTNTNKMRSRLELLDKARAKHGTPGNLVKGITSFLPQKPKAPTSEEIQQKKEEEHKKKQEKSEEAKRKREEMMRKKAEEQREKREARVRRVQEARQAKENEREKQIQDQAKEAEEKLAAIKKREEKLKHEAEKRRKENEARMAEAEERRAREEEARLARAAREEEENRQRGALEQERRAREDEERRRKMELARQEEEEKRKARERAEKEKKMAALEENRKKQEEARRQAEADRIAREKKEAELNSTYTKPNDITKKDVSSYDITPARHELPPESPKDPEDYGIDDLDSEGSTDNEESPRKKVPRWADGAELRTALLKQYYSNIDLDALFFPIEMPDLTIIFAQQRKRFFKRTSSACWNTPPSSFKHASRR